MTNLKCAVKGCNNNALVSYGHNWICGYCVMKIIDKQKKQKDKEIEEIGTCP